MKSQIGDIKKILHMGWNLELDNNFELSPKFVQDAQYPSHKTFYELDVFIKSHFVV
jgi:hypothetical protein